MAQIIRFYKHASIDDVLLNISTSREDVETVSENILTFTKKPSKIVSIDFDLTVNLEIFESVVPVSEIDPEKSVDYFLSYVSDSSRQRGFIKFKEDSSKISLTGRKHLSCSIDIDPSLYFGSIEFKGLIVRNKEFKKSRGFLTSKYSILGTSSEKRLYIDPFEKFDGSDMDVEFGKVTRPGALYQLQHSNPPKLIINEDAPLSIKEMFKFKGDTKVKAIVRDALFRPIVVDVWEQLARKAIEKMRPIEESSDLEVLDPENLEFPYNRVADLIAKASYGGSQKSAIDKLKDDIGDQKKRLKLINEQLPLVVQEIADLTNVYKLTSKNWWK